MTLVIRSEAALRFALLGFLLLWSSPLIANSDSLAWRYPRMAAGNAIHADTAHVYVADSALDSSGRLYVAGWISRLPAVEQSGLAVTMPPSTLTLGGGKTDVFVARFSADGNTMEYLAHLGGSGDEQVMGIAVDGEGRALIAGWTESPDFPTTDRHLRIGSGGDRDAFVLMIDSDGQSLVSSARIGGVEVDVANAIAIAPDGGVLLAGTTASPALPTTDAALQRAHRGKADGFVLKLDASLGTLQWFTFLGGPTMDEIHSVAVSAAGSVIVAGVTGDADNVDPDLPGTAGFFGSQYHSGRDAFVAKLSAGGEAVEWCGYLGGERLDLAKKVRVAPDGSIVVMGETYSVRTSTTAAQQPASVFPLVPAPQPGAPPVTFHLLATFLTSISDDGSQLLFSRLPTDIGGFASGFHVAPDGSLAVLGANSRNFSTPFGDPSTDLVTHSASHHWGSWAYAVVFNQDASQIRFNTRGFPIFRTSYRSMAFSADGRLHLVAETHETDIPLGPATATVPRLENPNHLRSAYVLTLRTDGETPCAPVLQGLPAELNPAGGTTNFQVRAEAGCPWNFLRGSVSSQLGAHSGLSFPAAGIGDGQLTFTYPPKESPGTGYYLLSGSMASSQLRQRSALCPQVHFHVNALAFGAEGGFQDVFVDAISGCNLQAEPLVPWPFTP
jgi:hypothetical protein